MSRRPPSARDPRNVGVTRTIPAVNRSTKGASASRLASPLPPSAKSSPVVSGGGGDSTHPGTGSNSMAVGPGTIASGDDSQAGGCAAQAIGRNSTAFGFAAIGLGEFSTAYGTNTYAEQEGVAVGGGAAALLSAVAVGGDDGGGDGATAFGTHATAVGSGTRAHGARSICLGSSAVVNDDDTGKVKVDAFEVEPSSGGSESSLILSDSSGARWAVTVDTTGHLTTTAL